MQVHLSRLAKQILRCRIDVRLDKTKTRQPKGNQHSVRIQGGSSPSERFSELSASMGHLQPKTLVQYFYTTTAFISSVCIFSYIWRHLDIGYVQGMCDLLAPLLVILDDGESSPLPLFPQKRCISAVLTTCPLTPSPFLFSSLQRPLPSAVSPSS